MSRQYLSSYAQYFLKFLQAYAAAGVPIQAITTQNEIDTDQHGQMPACTWSQECDSEFIIEHLGRSSRRQTRPRKSGSWTITLCIGEGHSQLDDPDFRRYANSVAWHGYTGEPG